MDRSTIESLVTLWAQEAVAAGRDEVWDELLAEGVVDVSGPAPSVGRESFRARAKAVQAALGERTITVDGLVIEGDRIAWRWTLQGRHTGPFMEVAPTGKRVTLRGVNFQRLEGGKVAEHWTLADLAGLARQLRGG